MTSFKSFQKKISSSCLKTARYINNSAHANNIIIKSGKALSLSNVPITRKFSTSSSRSSNISDKSSTLASLSGSSVVISSKKTKYTKPPVSFVQKIKDKLDRKSQKHHHHHHHRYHLESRNYNSNDNNQCHDQNSGLVQHHRHSKARDSQATEYDHDRQVLESFNITLEQAKEKRLQRQKHWSFVGPCLDSPTDSNFTRNAYKPLSIM